ncbi:hypothetical protein VP1G_11238 [Cytospora mali]|uniref:Uncharacterized protein n=1 Tax=Cytospora mali TaxID=578113 RepID=A0A194VAA4_CYTMA|nr:hypothetical protein VP1G_11238 [Valsa mali var. pyri (nom. inval.)]
MPLDQGRGNGEPTAGWRVSLIPRGKQLRLSSGQSGGEHGAAEDSKCQDELGRDLHLEEVGLDF